MIEPRYLNFSTLGEATSPRATSSSIPPFPSLNQHFKYSVFALLNLKPLVSGVSFQLVNLLPNLINKNQQIAYTMVPLMGDAFMKQCFSSFRLMGYPIWFWSHSIC